MKFHKLLPLLLLVYLLAQSFTTIKQRNEWTFLFNGKDLTGWDTYIGPDLDSTGKIIGKPVGLNNDPKHVFTIINKDGENIIRISGEAWGGISTKKEYENYHFQLKFKWGNLTWGQKKNKKKDSGLLYHAVGPHSADYGAWMRSQEFQIEEGNCGEYWGWQVECKIYLLYKMQTAIMCTILPERCTLLAQQALLADTVVKL
ncbi:MAG: DUF1080 domain-containing protein [Segetibacter sp.]